MAGTVDAPVAMLEQLADAQARSVAAMLSPAVPPADIAPWLRLAIALRDAGAPAIALALFAQLLAIRPDHTEALIEAGLIARRLGHGEAAMACFRAAIAADPSLPWPLVHLGTTLRDQGQHDGAMVVLRDAMHLQDDHFEAHLEAGITAAAQGAAAVAADYLDRAVEIRPENISARLNLAAALRAGGHLDKALTVYHDVLAIDPHNSDAAIEAGLVARRQGLRDAALALFQRAIDIAPDLVWPWLHCAVEFRDRGMLDNAMRCHAAALARGPTHCYAQKEAGITARLAGDDVASVAYFQAAIDADPHEAEPYFQLIAQQQRLRQFAAARGVLAAALSAGLDGAELRFEAALLALHEAPHATAAPMLAIFRANFDRSYDFLEQRVVQGRLSRDFLTQSARLYAASVAQSPISILDTASVAARIRAAISAGRAFSLIRAADGEGAFLSYFDPPADSASTSQEALHGLIIGNAIWRGAWFATDIWRQDAARLRALRDEFAEALADADIVGIPNPAFFPQLKFYIDYHGCARLHRAVTAQRTHGISETEIHLKLHQDQNLFAELLTNAAFVGVVTCHPGLGDRLRSELMVREVATYLVPHAFNQQDVFGYAPLDAGAPPHFPDIFDRLRRDIVVPFPGALFLVGAGLLGKIYCHWIRQRGGVALDIGAMADAFAGFNTRASIAAIYATQPLRQDGWSR